VSKMNEDGVSLLGIELTVSERMELRSR
jgi:hypothetical protein